MREVPATIMAAVHGPETKSIMPQKEPSSELPESYSISAAGGGDPAEEPPRSATPEPNLFDDPRSSDDPNNFYSRFLNMDDVSKYASDLANGLLLQQQQTKTEEENEANDENTVTTHYLTLKRLCILPKMTTDDVASWVYVMNAFQAITRNKEEGRFDNGGGAVDSSTPAVVSNERDGAANAAVVTRDVAGDEPIPHLYNSDDESWDDSVVLDIDAPVEEVEALEYIDAMEAAALEMQHTECHVHAVAQKDTQDCHIGIVFARQTPTSPLIIHRVGNRGIFSSSDLLPGMVVREINRRPMSFGVDPEDAFLELKGALSGEVSILAEGLVCTVQRLQRKQKIGLKLKGTQLGTVIISKITNKSIFKDSNLQPGMTIQCINGQLCPSSAKAAKFILKETIGVIQIVAIDGLKLEMERVSIVESGKIDKLFHKQNKISVLTQEVSVAGLSGPSSSTIPGERILVRGDAGTLVAPIQSETSILLNGGGLSASRFEVTVAKNSGKDQPGISFSRMDASTPLTIESIEKDGLFGHSDLVEGMIVVSINGESMTWKSPNVAAEAVATSNHVTLVAEAFVTTVVKTNACERVGMTLKKTSDGGNKIYIDKIPIGSKFSFTALKPGMVLLTINGRPCPKTIKETRALFADMGEGELTIMAVNVDRQWTTTSTQQQQHKWQHQTQRSDDVMETLNALAVTSSNSSLGMIFGNDSTEEDGAAARVEF